MTEAATTIAAQCDVKSCQQCCNLVDVALLDVRKIKRGHQGCSMKVAFDAHGGHQTPLAAAVRKEFVALHHVVNGLVVRRAGLQLNQQAEHQPQQQEEQQLQEEPLAAAIDDPADDLAGELAAESMQKRDEGDAADDNELDDLIEPRVLRGHHHQSTRGPLCFTVVICRK